MFIQQGTSLRRLLHNQYNRMSIGHLKFGVWLSNGMSMLWKPVTKLLIFPIVFPLNAAWTYSNKISSRTDKIKSFLYCYRKCMNRDVVVQGNPRVHKALKNEMAEILSELKRINKSDEVSDELLDIIELVSVTLIGLKGENANEWQKRNDRPVDMHPKS